MIAVKSIARYVMAGLLACGLCMSSALPALADGAKDQKKAPIKATKYYKDLRKKVKKNMVALNNCVIKYMPMDGEWKPGESLFKPSDLFMCQPQLNQMESSLAELLSPDTPPLLWESKEQQEKINLGNAAAKDFYELYLAPNRYLVNLVNTDPNMVGSIIQIQNLASWGCYVAPQLKEKLGDGVVLLASDKDGKVSLVAMATEGAMAKGAHAGNLIKEIAPIVGGGGGGRPNMAQAGGKNPAALDQAIAAVAGAVEKQL